jgi:hypothetical protein
MPYSILKRVSKRVYPTVVRAKDWLCLGEICRVVVERGESAPLNGERLLGRNHVGGR